MHARVTALEIDLGRASVDEVLNRFRAAVLPGLQEQPGYRGVYVMGTPEGRGLVVSLWATEAAARTMDPGGWYFGVLRDFARVFAADPGGVTYEVLICDVPGPQQSG